MKMTKVQLKQQEIVKSLERAEADKKQVDS